MSASSSSARESNGARVSGLFLRIHIVRLPNRACISACARWADGKGRRNSCRGGLRHRSDGMVACRLLRGFFPAVAFYCGPSIGGRGSTKSDVVNLAGTAPLWRFFGGGGGLFGAGGPPFSKNVEKTQRGGGAWG